jgi:hypothetical protein
MFTQLCIAMALVAEQNLHKREARLRRKLENLRFDLGETHFYVTRAVRMRGGIA